jgi:lambda repressor-like predicted transcriptional regulator
VSQLQTVIEVHKETEAFNELATRINGLPVEPRCRVCRNDALRRKVNDLLAVGTSYAMILRSIEDHNTKLDKRDRVTIDSIRNHTVRHFPVQNVAKATYREILERRAKENGVDFANGVATAITPMAFFETVMVKGYETLVDSGTKVNVSTGMIAAGRLQALLESRASGTSMAEMLVKMDRIISAIHSTVPKEIWPEILRKIDGDDEIQSAERGRGTFELDGECYRDDDFDEFDE